MTELVIAFIALTMMEIVLGIDNIVFIAIVTGRLPVEQQAAGRRVGLILALVMRILLLLSITWIMKLVDPIFFLESAGFSSTWFPGVEAEAWKEINAVSCKDLILFGGGLFLIYKSVSEIHKKLEGGGEEHDLPDRINFSGVLVQIALLDVIFSLDSVITAVGMVDTGEDSAHGNAGIVVMVAAIIAAVIVMLIFAGRVSGFVERHPTVKMLALSFLILIGVMLVAEGVGHHVNKNYIYFAMAFALGVELLNLKVRTSTVQER